MYTLRPISSTLLPSTTRSTTIYRPYSALNATFQRPTNNTRQLRSTRSFLSTPNPFTKNQTLTAQRTIRCPSSIVYSIISDVASYSAFLPFCQQSVVTKTSAPASDGKTYPEEAKLVIGFNDTISESFTSRVYCVPEKVVEAVSGNTLTTLPDADIAHHSPRADAAGDPSRNATVMSHLLTRWTLKPYHYKPPPVGAHKPEGVGKNHEETSPVPGQEKTEVNLAIEFQFANPIYAAMSSAAAPKVAEKMIEAFEKRVKAVIEGHGHARGEKEGIAKA